MPQPLEGAITDATRDTVNDPGMCLQQVRVWYEIPSKYGDATDAWTNALGKHTGDRNPPRGAPVFWTGGSAGHGHIVMSLGNGQVRSTDWPSSGKVGTTTIDELSNKWGSLKYAGWAEGFNGVWIPELKGGATPPPSAPAPVAASDYTQWKAEFNQTFQPRTWTEMQFTEGSRISTDGEHSLFEAQLHLELPDSGIEQPYYVKMQFCRHTPSGLDTTGTTTFTIAPSGGTDLHLGSWQGTALWFIAPEDPVSCRVYIGGDHAIKSPLRQFKRWVP